MNNGELANRTTLHRRSNTKRMSSKTRCYV